MLGITKISPGRLGNRLFHYHFLRQVAKKTGLDYFHCKFPESAYFEEMEKVPRPFPHFFKKSIKLTSKDVLSFSPQDFLSFIKLETEKGKDIILEPPMLGELFFDYLFYSPNEFVKVKSQYRKDFQFDSRDKVIIAAHFRGTDFPSWNPCAALKFSYYREAIDFCLEYFRDKNPVVILFTDDNECPAFLEVIDFLKSQRVEFYTGDNSRLAIYDFYQISQCDVLISSPSTFAIFSSCLGKPKKIIHEKNWLEYMVSRKDKFWVDLNQTKNPYYSLWKIF